MCVTGYVTQGEQQITRSFQLQTTRQNINTTTAPPPTVPHKTAINMYRHLYRCIWLILQFLLDILELINWLFVLIRTILIRSYDRRGDGLEKFDYDTLKHCQALLSKKPSHIAVIVGPAAKHVNKTLFERLFTYALQMDIPCISIYDTRSNKSDERFLLEKISMPKYMQSEIFDETHCFWTVKQMTAGNGKLLNGACSKSNGSINIISKIHVNGNLVPDRHESYDKSLEIFKFTMQDNIASISEICKELFSKRHTTEIQQKLKDRAQLTQCIDEALTQRLFGSTCRNGNSTIKVEPDLCLVFNAYLCTFGMLPWHTRFTEFYNFKSGAEFNATSFSDVLCRYSRVQQRWGK